MLLRNVHQTLTVDYELPSYVSYVLFALGTILLGGVLGLLMVCCVDCLCPGKGQHHQVGKLAAVVLNQGHA